MNSSEYRRLSPNKPIDTIVESIRAKGIGKPDCSIILGSGLGSFTNALQSHVLVPYKDLPGFPQTGVAGHNGALYFGMLGPRRVLAWSGRFHYYEGHPFERTILPVQITNALGCNALIVTNAAGGINERFQVGDLMLIDDIITLMVSVSPHHKPLYLRYANDEAVNTVIRLAANAGIPVTRGCYLFARGPNYETKAEIRAFRSLGADAVGMSTAAELYEAVRLGMTCIGISLITNQATGVSKKKLKHSEIKETAQWKEKEFEKLVSTIISDNSFYRSSKPG